MENSEKTYAMRILPAATDRLGEHYDFLAAVNEIAAERLAEKLLAVMHSLRYMPYRNPEYHKPPIQPDRYRYLLCERRYRIVYHIQDDIVFIDDIEDTRQDDDKSPLYPQ